MQGEVKVALGGPVAQPSLGRSPVWASGWGGGPGAWAPGSGMSWPTCPPGGGLCYSVRAQRGQPRVPSWKLKPRAECWQEMASSTHVPKAPTHPPCHTQRPALAPSEAT